MITPGISLNGKQRSGLSSRRALIGILGSRAKFRIYLGTPYSRIYLINAVGSGQHGYDGCNTQFGQPIRMSGVIGRQVDLEPGLDGRSDKAPVFDGDRIVAEDGLVGEGDCVLAGVGGDELVEERAVDLSSVAALATTFPPERILLSSSWEYRASAIAQLTEVHEEEIWFWKQQNARKRAARARIRNACAVFDFGLVLRSKCRCAGLCGDLNLCQP